MKSLYLVIVTLILISSFYLHAQSWDQSAKLVASDRANDDWFGYSAAISENFAIISAPIEDHDAAGLNFFSGAGSAYAYQNNAGTWTQTQKLVAPDRSTNGNFGFSISIYGNYAAISANSDDLDESGNNPLTLSGSVHIFQNNSGTWSHVQKIVASDREQAEQFGTALSMNGNYLFVGVPAEDEAAPGDDVLSFAGAVYIFENISGTWTEIQKIVPSDRAVSDQFGRSVAVSGNYAFIGASHEDQDASGNNTLTDAGSVYVYQNIAGTWTQVQKIVPSDRGANDLFGFSTSMSGDYAIVGAYQEDQDISGGNTLSNAGSAYIFHNDGGSWTQVQKITSSDRGADDRFGWAVSLSADYAIISAYQEDEDASGASTLADAGSAYIFKNTAGTWSQVEKVVATDREAGDNFGYSVAISGNYALAAAYQEDHDANGLNPRTNSGSAYLFHDPLVLPVELTSFTATLSNNGVQLNWQTASEVNNFGFEILRRSQKSEDRSQNENSGWEKIGFIAGNGNSNSVKSYSFVDKNPFEGKSYYRLKQIDNDGQFEYSDIVEASFMNPGKFALEQNYPNPFNPVTSIIYSIGLSPEESSTVQLVSLIVYDILGKEVAVLVNEEKGPGTYETEFNAADLSSGIYYYTIRADSYSTTKKLILLK